MRFDLSRGGTSGRAASAIPMSAVTALLLGLAACAGGSSSGSLAQSSDASLSALKSPQVNEAQSDAVRVPLAVATPGPNDLLYVGNLGNASITVYRHDANGNAAPLRVIAGANTGITQPMQLSEDAAGNLYVANTLPEDVLVFAPGAEGNVKPLRVLHIVPAADGDSLGGMTVDQATGKLYVVDNTGGEGAGATLDRFAFGASGFQAPLASGSITYFGHQLASDSTGKNLIEAHPAACCTFATNGTTTVPKQFYPGTTPLDVYDVGAVIALGIADDPTTKTYLVTTGSSIVRLAENTVGAAANDGHASTLKPSIVSTITSDTCGGNLALGDLRNIYVVHSTNGANGYPDCPSDAVYVYEHDAAGNATPLRILTGPATKLDQPSAIYEGR